MPIFLPLQWYRFYFTHVSLAYFSGDGFAPQPFYNKTKCFNNVCIKHPYTETSQLLQLLPISPLVVDKTVVKDKYWLETENL